MVAAFDERRSVVVDGLNALPGVSCRIAGRARSIPSPTSPGTGLDARTFQNRLLEEAGVATVAGTSFGGFGEGYVRFSYANSAENIRRALDRGGRDAGRPQRALRVRGMTAVRGEQRPHGGSVSRRAAWRSAVGYPERVNFWRQGGVNGARRATAPEATVTSPT